MNKQTLLEAEAEAKRFLERLQAVKATDRYKSEFSKFDVGGSKESAAVKRASMDLSRALAKLRK
jgi:ABC-type arginine transport system ATPase subunit